MTLCQTSYALGSISAARSSLASAQRAIERDGDAHDPESKDRALVALGKALVLLEAAMHELGAEIAAYQLAATRQTGHKRASRVCVATDHYPHGERDFDSEEKLG